MERGAPQRETEKEGKRFFEAFESQNYTILERKKNVSASVGRCTQAGLSETRYRPVKRKKVKSTACVERKSGGKLWHKELKRN